DAEMAVAAVAEKNGIKLTAIGELKTARGGRPMIEIR
ncbi:MAG TPA: selenide, water dikinase SelD, partial [Buttiauxella sp.]|nr:selenide, water dikinase SelD [Buttiauxella sp.]